MCTVQNDMLHVFCKRSSICGIYKGTNLLQDQDLVGCLQVLQLVGHQDTRLVLQQATDTPDTWTHREECQVLALMQILLYAVMLELQSNRFTASVCAPSLS